MTTPTFANSVDSDQMASPHLTTPTSEFTFAILDRQKRKMMELSGNSVQNK